MSPRSQHQDAETSVKRSNVSTMSIYTAVSNNICGYRHFSLFNLFGNFPFFQESVCVGQDRHYVRESTRSNKTGVVAGNIRAPFSSQKFSFLFSVCYAFIHSIYRVFFSFIILQWLQLGRSMQNMSLPLT